MPPRGRRRDDGGGIREADRRPGDLLRDARAGRHAGLRRRAHGLPGRDAAPPLRRPGASRGRGARGVPGDRLPPHVRPAREVGRTGRPGRAHPRADRAGVPRRDLRPTRPGGARAAGGRARRRRRRAGRLAVRAGAGGAGDGRADGGARPARIRRASARDRRWPALERGCRGRSRGLVRGGRDPGRRGVALPGLRRQRGLLLRGPSRRRRRPGAPRPPARRGRPARRRRPPRGHRDGRLRDHRPSRRGADADPRPSRPGRDRPGLRAGARDRVLRAALRRGAPRGRAARPGRARRHDGRSARRVALDARGARPPRSRSRRPA